MLWLCCVLYACSSVKLWFGPQIVKGFVCIASLPAVHLIVIFKHSSLHCVKECCGAETWMKNARVCKRENIFISNIEI